MMHSYQKQNSKETTNNPSTENKYSGLVDNQGHSGSDATNSCATGPSYSPGASYPDTVRSLLDQKPPYSPGASYPDTVRSSLDQKPPYSPGASYPDTVRSSLDQKPPYSPGATYPDTASSLQGLNASLPEDQSHLNSVGAGKPFGPSSTDASHSYLSGQADTGNKSGSQSSGLESPSGVEDQHSGSDDDLVERMRKLRMDDRGNMNDDKQFSQVESRISNQCNKEGVVSINSIEDDNKKSLETGEQEKRNIVVNVDKSKDIWKQNLDKEKLGNNKEAGAQEPTCQVHSHPGKTKNDGQVEENVKDLEKSILTPSVSGSGSRMNPSPTLSFEGTAGRRQDISNATTNNLAQSDEMKFDLLSKTVVQEEFQRTDDEDKRKTDMFSNAENQQTAGLSEGIRGGQVGLYDKSMNSMRGLLGTGVGGHKLSESSSGNPENDYVFLEKPINVVKDNIYGAGYPPQEVSFNRYSTEGHEKIVPTGQISEHHDNSGMSNTNDILSSDQKSQLQALQYLNISEDVGNHESGNIAQACVGRNNIDIWHNNPYFEEHGGNNEECRSLPMYRYARDSSSNVMGVPENGLRRANNERTTGSGSNLDKMRGPANEEDFIKFKSEIQQNRASETLSSTEDSEEAGTDNYQGMSKIQQRIFSNGNHNFFGSNFSRQGSDSSREDNPNTKQSEIQQGAAVGTGPEDSKTEEGHHGNETLRRDKTSSQSNQKKEQSDGQEKSLKVTALPATTTLNRILLKKYGDIFRTLLDNWSKLHGIKIQDEKEDVKLVGNFVALKEVKKCIEAYVRDVEKLQEASMEGTHGTSDDNSHLHGVNSSVSDNDSKQGKGAIPKVPGKAQAVTDSVEIAPVLPQRKKWTEGKSPEAERNKADTKEGASALKQTSSGQAGTSKKERDDESVTRSRLLRNLYYAARGSPMPDPNNSSVDYEQHRSKFDFDLHAYLCPYYAAELDKTMKGHNSYFFSVGETEKKELLLMFTAKNGKAAENMIEIYKKLLKKLIMKDVAVGDRFVADLCKEIEENQYSSKGNCENEVGICTCTIGEGKVIAFGFNSKSIDDTKLWIQSRIRDYSNEMAMIKKNDYAVVKQPQSENNPRQSNNSDMKFDDQTREGRVWFMDKIGSHKPTLKNLHYKVLHINPNMTELKFVTKQNITVYVCQDNFVEPRHIREVQVIVNPTNSSFIFGNGLSRIIANRAGTEVIGECRRHLDTVGGQIGVTGYYSSNPGNLAWLYNNKLKKIIHAVGPDPYHYAKWLDGVCAFDHDKIFQLTSQTYYKCLMHTNDDLKEAAIAFPPFGSGIYQVPAPLIVEAAVNALQEMDKHMSGYSGKSQHLKHVYFVTVDHTVIRELVPEFLKYCYKETGVVTIV